LVDGWRQAYQPALDEVRCGRREWDDLDAINTRTLDVVLRAQGLALDRTARGILVDGWRRLRPWPDVPDGLASLSRRFVTAPLSNAPRAMMRDLAGFAGLRFDRYLSAADARTYKPDHAVYRTACAALGLRPQAVMMVAAHADDLTAAGEVGCRTAFVRRPAEWGAKPTGEPQSPANVDRVVTDLLELDRRLPGRPARWGEG
jgi:2-haloacid dehalogenase